MGTHQSENTIKTKITTIMKSFFAILSICLVLFLSSANAMQNEATPEMRKLREEATALKTNYLAAREAADGDEKALRKLEAEFKVAYDSMKNKLDLQRK